MSVVASLGRVLAVHQALPPLDQASLTPPAASTLMLSADFHWRRKEWQAAIDAASRVINRRSKDFHALAILASSYSHLGQSEAAHLYAKQLVAVHPPSWIGIKVLLTLLRSFRLVTAEGRAIHRGIMRRCDEEAQADRDALAWAQGLISKATQRPANDDRAV